MSNYRVGGVGYLVPRGGFLVGGISGPSKNANLRSISAAAAAGPAVSLSPAFSPTRTNYIVRAFVGQVVTVTGVKSSGGATVGTATVGDVTRITVTAADMVTTRVYTVTVQRVQDNDADLRSLAVTVAGAPAAISPHFNRATHAYTLAAKVGAAVVVNAQVEGWRATVAQATVDDVTTVTVTAQDGTQQAYTVTVERYVMEWTVAPRGAGSIYVLWPNTTDARDTINPDPPVFTYGGVDYTIVDVAMAKDSTSTHITVSAAAVPAEGALDALDIDWGLANVDRQRFDVADNSVTDAAAFTRRWTWAHAVALLDRWRGGQSYTLRFYVR